MDDQIIENIGCLLLPNAGPLKGEAMKELPVRHQAALAVKGEQVVWTGSTEEAQTRKAHQRFNAEGKVVSPGLVDPHTHLVFGGSREEELALKQAGTAYLDILKRGGGILSTVRATRQADEQFLFEKARSFAGRMAAYGVTTLEAKSGYGLDEETELKQLSVIDRLNNEGLLDIAATFLGPHAIPPEFKRREDVFLDMMIDLLPVMKEKTSAAFTDIFCETGVFTTEQAARFMEASQRHGFQVKIHADEIDPLGGTELAVQYGAVSADHLVAASAEGIQQLAASDTMAVLLPGTTFYLGKDTYADARRMIQAGAAVALATDFNPGSCVTHNLQMIMALAALKMKMTPEEIWNAVTVNASHAIGMEKTAGRITVGGQADLVLWDIPNYKYLPYHYGVNHARAVWKRGRLIWERREADVFPIS